MPDLGAFAVAAGVDADVTAVTAGPQRLAAVQGVPAAGLEDITVAAGEGHSGFGRQHIPLVQCALQFGVGRHEEIRHRRDSDARIDAGTVGIAGDQIAGVGIKAPALVSPLLDAVVAADNEKFAGRFGKLGRRYRLPRARRRAVEPRRRQRFVVGVKRAAAVIHQRQGRGVGHFLDRETRRAL